MRSKERPPRSAIRERSFAAAIGTRSANPNAPVAQASPLHGVAGTAAGTGEAIAIHRVPLFPAASDDFREGFVRVVNHSPLAGEIRVDAVDDAGRRHGPITLQVSALEAAHFNSGDLERGNEAKGLSGGTGVGTGDWRLALDSDLDIEVLSYVRTADGFLTAMHDVVASLDGAHRVPTFNPASNRDQVSRLRLVNLGDSEAEVDIVGIDDRGDSPGDAIRVSIPASAARTFSAEQLEPATDARNGLGDGTGKWRLEVASEQPIEVMSLLESPTGHLTNLSTAPENVHNGAHAVPLFPAAGNARQGFVRIINHSARPGEVEIIAFDESDWDHDSITLNIAANAAAHFNSQDLETGNPDKGLSGGTGPGQGDW